jgi:hypothetical protein
MAFTIVKIYHLQKLEENRANIEEKHHALMKKSLQILRRKVGYSLPRKVCVYRRRSDVKIVHL